MRLFFIYCVTIFLLFTQSVFAHPYWNAQRVPKDSDYAKTSLRLPQPTSVSTHDLAAIDVLRIQLDWQEKDESYRISKTIIEPSGTTALMERSKLKPQYGSYIGVLKDTKTGQSIYYDSIGTGKEYRKLTRAITLRFPLITGDMLFELFAENPKTGGMEKVISQVIRPAQLQKALPIPDTEIKELASASQSPSVRVSIYAEGYHESDKKLFWQHAQKTVQTLQSQKFPGVEHMSFYAVFHASKRTLGEPEQLGLPVPTYDSFLGLYYPYWDDFGRWTDVIYPTNENKLRENLASAPYDYPLVLVNNSNYWGVGNYMAFTAIPAANDWNFTYLLTHEFGHFFGLNEEYEGGGRTELEFAPGIHEPWSQNITFLVDKHYENLKWKQFVKNTIPLPTPESMWKASPPVYGAYVGGYADSLATKKISHKPGLKCTMETDKNFCAICTHAIEQVIQHSIGFA